MTLTQVATITKRGVFLSIALLILSITGFIFYQVKHTQYLASLPKPEEIPDVKFGILPRPDFLPSSVSSSNFSYQLANQTGSLSDFGKLAKVYFIPKATAAFLAKDKASSLAAKFNIDSVPEATGESYQFRKDNKILNLDINTGNLKYKKEATSPAQHFTSTETQVIQNFKTFLSFLGLLKDELKAGTGKVTGTTILIWPQDINKIPIVTSKFNKSLIIAEASQSAASVEDYAAIDFTFWPVDQTTFSTYPIKTAAQALGDLKAGQGSVIIEPKGVQVSITSVYLAYFESENYNPYLLPVFVVEGPNFVAFVPAITNEFTAK